MANDQTGLRITTWNVNGIKNPFGYQPWRDKKTFQSMFEILEADIVVMQETKIQRKDLGDDMVLVPGWDVYFSLPKHKKGYSGVAIYTRNASCAPIRAEEGITGVLCPPGSSVSYHDLPESQQIGGYPSVTQLSDCALDAATLDSEGRCVILEFPAFVLIGVYSPANRDESRDEFRLGFLNALDARVRNIVASGKRVVLTGDLNIIREELDTANAEEQLRKHGMTGEEYVSTPARRLFNQLIVGGKVIGEKDEGREQPVLWDICRSFHPNRKGMFTCWEQKKNARPGNFGSRIDYVLCGHEIKDWFSASDIQEGLMGSDHCPVYAVMHDIVTIDGVPVKIRDVMNPIGMFENGVRQREWTAKDLLPMSAKLIPEFDRRRNIREMFIKQPSIQSEGSLSDNISKVTQQPYFSINNAKNSEVRLPTENSVSMFLGSSESSRVGATDMACQSVSDTSVQSSPLKVSVKRPVESPAVSRTAKRSKPGTAKSSPANGSAMKGQSSLMGFFKTKASPEVGYADQTLKSTTKLDAKRDISTSAPPVESHSTASSNRFLSTEDSQSQSTMPFSIEDQDDVIDPIVAKETWSRLLGKRVVPRCEHNEPCVSYLTKKAGINCGRSFYMCPRPLGPSGSKEKGTQWRCGTFIWSSDWTGDGT